MENILLRPYSCNEGQSEVMSISIGGGTEKSTPVCHSGEGRPGQVGQAASGTHVKIYTDIDTCDSEYDMEVLEEGYGSDDDN